jgi:protein-tyrosine-phosphatase
MAEGFAAYYGSDVLTAESAGLSPAGVVVDQTIRSMSGKNIDISSHYSKAFHLEEANHFDLVVNMSGYDVPRGLRVPVIRWDIPDPIGESDQIYANVRDQIEKQVVELVADLRLQAAKR